MLVEVDIAPGLPPYGPPALPFPAEFGEFGREGVVVHFRTTSGSWFGNFRPGFLGIDFVASHPNGLQAVVIASGDLWVVDPEPRSAALVLSGVDALIVVDEPAGWIVSRHGLALMRLGPSGVIWHTRRISWDGFDNLTLNGRKLTGLAFSPIDDDWKAFEVDIRSGRSVGGSFAEHDAEGWEVLSQG